MMRNPIQLKQVQGDDHDDLGIETQLKELRLGIPPEDTLFAGETEEFIKCRSRH